MRTKEWGYVPPYPNYQVNWAHGGSYETGSSSGGNSNVPDSQYSQGYGHSGAPSPVHTQRKLVFGTFGPAAPTNPEPEKTFFLCAGRHER